MKKVNLLYYKLRYKLSQFFYWLGGDNINYFFRFLLPQLLEYFNNDKEVVKEFIPKIIEQQCNNLLLEYDEKLNVKDKIGA